MAALVISIAVAEIVIRTISPNVPTTLRWYDATAQLKVEQMDVLDHVDVVFAGTSMAWQGFVPSSFTAIDGRTSYNAGLAGGVPQVMERWLLEEVEPRLTPSLVIWGISSLDLSPAYGADNREIYDEALETRIGALANVERFSSLFFRLVRDRTVFRDASQMWGKDARSREEAFAEAGRILGADGERLDFEQDLSTERGAVQQARLSGFAIDPEDVRAIETTIEGLQDRGVEVILVEMPVPDRFIAAHPNGSTDHVLVRQALGSIATLHDVRLLALDNGFTDDDFVDFTHLNAAASNEFTTAVAEGVGSGRNDATAPVLIVDSVDAFTTTGSNCHTELVVDEYGIAVEIQMCDEAGDPGDPTPRAGSLAEWLGSEPALGLAALLRDRLAYQTGCGHGATNDTRMSDAAQTLPNELDAALLDDVSGAFDRMDAACLEDNSRWMTELETAIQQTLDLGVALGGQHLPYVTYQTDEIAERTAMAVGAVEALYSWLATTDSYELSYFWFSAADLLFARQRRQAILDGEEPEIIIIGASIAARAFDQQELSNALGLRVVNMSIPSSPSEAYTIWLPEWLDPMPTTRVVWALSAHRLMASPTRCDNLASGQLPAAATRPVDARQNLFATIPDLKSIDPLDLAFGPTNGEPLAQTYLGELSRVSYDATGLIPNLKDFRGVTDRHKQLFAENIACEAVFDLIFESISDLSRDGIEVTIVLIPNHPAVRGLNTELFEEIENRLRARAATDGVDVIELPGPLRSEETYDGVHPNIVGRDRLTKDLIGALAQAE